MQYIGRFAPSPTGPLHFGSLVAAVASYCDAKKNNGKWLIRMEDLDKSREMAGAADAILQQLERFGFAWDGAIVYQSQRADIYQEYLQHLKRDGLVYSCSCSRKEIADSSIVNGIDGAIYPKTCYNKISQNTPQNSSSNFNAAASRIDIGSQRINVDNAEKISFFDAIQGEIAQTLQTDVGDFILKRKDGFFAYQLAVVVDDALQGVNHVVRGADLLDSTPRQIYLQRLLSFTTPNYTHVPVATNVAGEKLSKQTLAQPLNSSLNTQQLFDTLHYLGQNPPAELKVANLQECWSWAISHWNLANVPKQEKMMIQT
jgi:glutamyl-Q tRNA(Asp) synthetase